MGYRHLVGALPLCYNPSVQEIAHGYLNVRNPVYGIPHIVDLSFQD